jgi:hypothetical protein
MLDSKIDSGVPIDKVHGTLFHVFKISEAKTEDLATQDVPVVSCKKVCSQ